jgi:hypothetical protein
MGFAHRANAPVPCGGAQSLSVMLHAGIFHVTFDILPSAGPFDVAAVGVAGGTVISIDPASHTYSASVATITAAAAAGDFSQSVVPGLCKLYANGDLPAISGSKPRAREQARSFVGTGDQDVARA